MQRPKTLKHKQPKEPQMPDEEYKVLGVRLDPELHHQFKVHCVQQGLVMAEVVRKLIIEWMAKQNQRSKEEPWIPER